MLTLYTRQNCAPCLKTKLIIEQENYKVEIKEETQEYSKTYPTLVGGWYFVTNSSEIIDFLKTIKHD